MTHKKLLIGLATFTSISYIAITISVPIPLFIKFENIIYTLLYIIFTYLALKKIYSPLIALIFFNAGRISRSVLTPYGELAPMAMQHLPLLIFLILYGLTVIYIYRKEKR